MATYQPLGRMFALRIAPGATELRAYRLVPSHRGSVRLAGFRVSTRFPFGLFAKACILEHLDEALVYPAVDGAQSLRALRLGEGEGRAGPLQPETGSEVVGLRPFAPGDSLRRVHWRATLRRGLPVVRQSEEPRAAEAAIYLATRGPSEGDGFEQSVRRAATQVVRLLEAGARVSLKIDDASRRITPAAAYAPAGLPGARRARGEGPIVARSAPPWRRRGPLALALVTLASLTLAVSGQISPLVLALQAVAIAAAALRHAPRPGQQRSPWLNTALAASALLALLATLRGAPVTVGLAHFALLASGVQLLDARPRRSEFLLVALALFQVVLASSLTDSLWFPPLLMAFLPTCVWTLLVHTLRSEALEAGDPAAAADAITPGLLGMTLAASGLSLVLALALFFLLPRLHEGLVRVRGTPRATSGFSDRVDLDDLGRIHADPTRAGCRRSWNAAAGRRILAGLVFDRFDGRAWSVSCRNATAWTEKRPKARLRGTDHRTRAPSSGSPWPPSSLAPEPRLPPGRHGSAERDGNGGLYAPESADARVRYEVSVRSTTPGDDVLAGDVAALPVQGERFLSLPELSPEIGVLAQRIVDGAPDDLARARALEGWLRSHGRYSDTPPHAETGDLRTPLERFLLGELSAHCEYFASAMVVMARSVGLPARLVNGFAGGHRNRVGDFVELSGSDAHAWVELHFRDHGWMRFDPTPPDRRLAAADANPDLRQRLSDLRSALELFWFQQVVEFDRGQQVQAAIGTRTPGLSRTRTPGGAESRLARSPARAAGAAPGRPRQRARRRPPGRPPIAGARPSPTSSARLRTGPPSALPARPGPATGPDAARLRARDRGEAVPGRSRCLRRAHRGVPGPALWRSPGAGRRSRAPRAP
jgi:transglutaminase-like putative cysteine protease